MSIQRDTVEIMEVAPRDGFQSIAEPLPTLEKIEIIQGLIDAGCRRLEFGAFVSPKAVPQMADMGEIAEHFEARGDLRLCVLVPNLKGAEMARRHALSDLGYVYSASEAHNQRNVRRSRAQSIDGLRELVAFMRDVPDARLRINIATSFDCPFDGTVDLATLRDAITPLWDIVDDAEIALCDTTGRAHPHQVRTAFETMMAECPHPGITWAFHGHDTFGMGVANALFAHQAGVRVFDASAAGLGGCPFAPGATGNTATEDLLFAFHEAGIDSGIDLPRLLEVADRIAGLPGGITASHLRMVPRARVA